MRRQRKWFVEGEYNLFLRVIHTNVFLFVSGMPTVDGYALVSVLGVTYQLKDFVSTRLKRALERVNAGPNGTNMVYWTSLREVWQRSCTFLLMY